MKYTKLYAPLLVIGTLTLAACGGDTTGQSVSGNGQGIIATDSAIQGVSTGGDLGGDFIDDGAVTLPSSECSVESAASGLC